MLISQIGLLEPIQNQNHGIVPGCPENPYRYIHTKCPLILYFFRDSLFKRWVEVLLIHKRIKPEDGLVREPSGDP